MKLAVHITFFYRDEKLDDRWTNAKDKFPYLRKIINEYNQYPLKVDIFIHTNKKFNLLDLKYNTYTNGKIQLIKHNLYKYSLFKGKNYYLTWASRKTIKKQRNEYDFFIYQEDDIFIPLNAFNYWQTKKKDYIKNNLNLGFLRIELKDEIEYVSDLDMKIDKLMNLDKREYVINDVNPYCAFWIYDKTELNKWIKSKFWDLKNIHGKGAIVSNKLEKIGLNNFPILRYLIYSYKNKRPDSAMEASAIGINGLNLGWYKNTVLPIQNRNVDPDCRIYHLSNYYANEYETNMGTIKFDEIIS